MRIELKHRWDKSILFEHGIEGNTVAKTLMQAGKLKINLEGVNLKYANLRNANLQGFDLSDANLRFSDLQNANLKDACLQNTDLQNANLKDACLLNTDMWSSHLEGVNLENTGLMQIVGLGSVGRCTTFDLLNNRIFCGCWYGNFEQFEERVKKTYPKNSHHRDNYLKALDFVKTLKIV